MQSLHLWKEILKKNYLVKKKTFLIYECLYISFFKFTHSICWSCKYVSGATVNLYIYIYIYIERERERDSYFGNTFLCKTQHLYMMDSAADLDIWGPNCSVKDMKFWITYTGDLFIVVKVCIEPVILLDELLTKEWTINMGHILLNDTLQILNSDFFLLLDQLPNQS